MRIKELDVVSKRQQEEEGEEISVVDGTTACPKAVGTQRNVKESLQHGKD